MLWVLTNYNKPLLYTPYNGVIATIDRSTQSYEENPTRGRHRFRHILYRNVAPFDIRTRRFDHTFRKVAIGLGCSPNIRHQSENVAKTWLFSYTWSVRPDRGIDRGPATDAGAHSDYHASLGNLWRRLLQQIYRVDRLESLNLRIYGAI